MSFESYFSTQPLSPGGYNITSGEAIRSVVCWNPLGKTKETEWINVSEMKTARYMPASVVMDGKLFVAGGYDPKTHK